MTKKPDKLQAIRTSPGDPPQRLSAKPGDEKMPDPMIIPERMAIPSTIFSGPGLLKGLLSPIAVEYCSSALEFFISVYSFTHISRRAELRIKPIKNIKMVGNWVLMGFLKTRV